MLFYFFFFFKQKTAYEMRISDWSSDVCSSDLDNPAFWGGDVSWVTITDMRSGVIESTEECITTAGLGGSSAKLFPRGTLLLSIFATIGRTEIGRASCRERVCQYV